LEWRRSAERSMMMAVRLALLLGLFGTVANAEPWSDTPAWPKAKTGELVWVVSPPIVTADPNAMPNQPVALEVTLGTVTRTIKLAPELGSMKPYNQPMCKQAGRVDAYALGKGEVAKLTFYEGGAGGYVIARSGDELSVIRWSLEDGACEDKHHQPVGCPRKDKRVARFHVPAGVKLHEQILEVDDKGARHPFDCE
jgi:hypothetical protein